MSANQRLPELSAIPHARVSETPRPFSGHYTTPPSNKKPKFTSIHGIHSLESPTVVSSSASPRRSSLNVKYANMMEKMNGMANGCFSNEVTLQKMTRVVPYDISQPTNNNATFSPPASARKPWKESSTEIDEQDFNDQYPSNDETLFYYSHAQDDRDEGNDEEDEILFWNNQTRR